MSSLVNNILNRSILSFVNPNQIQSLLEKSQERKFQKSENLSTVISVRTLTIIIDGQVELIDRSTQSRLEKLIPGKSIELDTLLNNKKRWSYDWVATQNTTVLLIPFEEFCLYLSADYLSYLKIIRMILV